LKQAKDDIDSLKQLLGDNPLNFLSLNSDEKSSSAEDLSPSEDASEPIDRKKPPEYEYEDSEEIYNDLSFFKVDEKTLEMIKQIPDLTIEDDDSDKDDFLKTWKLIKEEGFEDQVESEQTEYEEEPDQFSQMYQTEDLKNALEKLSVFNGEEESSSNDTEHSDKDTSSDS